MTPVRNDPLVSVVIPAYNASEWIGSSIQSVLSQTCANLEILVIDDGSTDDTYERVSAFSDPRLCVLHQDNAGAAAARNRGLREMRGDLVQFLDADDILSPDKIRAQVAALADAPRDAVASCAWYAFANEVSDAERRAEPVWAEVDPLKWLVRSLAGEGMMQPAGWLVPRTVSDRAGEWNASLTLHDDTEYFARVLLNATRNVFVKGPSVFYRNTAGSLSRRRGRSAAISSLNVCMLLEETLLPVRDTTYTRAAVATRYAQFAYEFIDSYPDLGQTALERLNALLVNPANAVGGAGFRTLTRLVGFQSALRIRSAIPRGERFVRHA